MKSIMRLAAVALVIGTGQAAVAQEATLSDRQVTLYSEMWAMAGVCSQLPGYDVKHDDLADFLNDLIGDAQHGDQERILQARDERLDVINGEIARRGGLDRGNRRSREIEEFTEQMMTRCLRLVNNDTASEFFLRRG